MKLTSAFWLLGAGLLAAFAFAAELPTPSHTAYRRSSSPHYVVKDLGTLGGLYSWGFGISSTGLVGGAAARSDQTDGVSATAFLWRHGNMLDLGTLGGLNSGASVVNSSGEVALSSETAVSDPYNEDFCASHTHAQCVAAVWKNGLRALPELVPGGNSQAYGINDEGEVSGFSEIDRKEPDASCATPYQRFHFEAVIWKANGEIRQLDPLPGDTVSFSWGINNKGPAVGGSGSCSTVILPPNIPSASHAVLWERNGKSVDLGTLGNPPAGMPALNLATAINNQGDVVGASLVEDGTFHEFLWTRKTGMQDLGTFPGMIATVFPCCNVINDGRQIAGFAIDQNGNSHAILWERGIWMDLNHLISKDSGWTLQAAESINDAGQITGFGLRDGDTEPHAFLATPCDDHNGRKDCEVRDR